MGEYHQHMRRAGGTPLSEPTPRQVVIDRRIQIGVSGILYLF